MPIDTLSRARKDILQLLKLDGALPAEHIAKKLRVTAMAVRQHLYEMAEQKLVTFEEIPGPVGRPKKSWKLSRAADAFFPNGSQDLLVDVLDSVRRLFGAEGIDKIVAARSDEQRLRYTQELQGLSSLKERLKKLAALRTQEGYMAEFVTQSPREFLLIENHCPICSAATRCQRLCQSELELFRDVLGPGTLVERAEHIIQGARRCVYRVRTQA